jgi:hypothetical protein
LSGDKSQSETYLKHFIASTCPANVVRRMAFTTIHYDDSGTDPNQKIAVAACYVATPEQWIEFCRNWDEIDREEHFGVFHMAVFAANQKDSPFENWDRVKKKRVLRKLCSVITTRAEVGFARAVSKKDYDAVIVDSFRRYCGEFHYTFTLRQCAGAVALHRKTYHEKSSMRCIFDWMAKGNAKREITSVMDAALIKSEIEKQTTGVMSLEGYSFEKKSVVIPLQAADILAWTIYQKMQKLLSNKPIVWEADMAYDLLKHSRCRLDDGFFGKDNLTAWADSEMDAVIAEFKRRKALSQQT